MLRIYPRYASASELARVKFAQNWGKMSTRLLELGQYVSLQKLGVKMSLGHFVLGHFVLWGKMYLGLKFNSKDYSISFLSVIFNPKV